MGSTVRYSLYTLVAQTDAGALIDRLVADGYRIRRLDGATLDGAASLWAASAAQLGHLPVSGWDGFADRLHGALWPDDGEGDRIALVWEHADVLVAADLDAFLHAFDVLCTVGRSAYAQEVHILAFYLGDGRGYPRLAQL
jgi:hypothetical protein